MFWTTFSLTYISLTKIGFGLNLTELGKTHPTIVSFVKIHSKPISNWDPSEFDDDQYGIGKENNDEFAFNVTENINKIQEDDYRIFTRKPRCDFWVWLGRGRHFRHYDQEICHYIGYNNTLSKFSEFSFAVYYSKIEFEIYKGNCEKYKGKSELD